MEPKTTNNSKTAATSSVPTSSSLSSSRTNLNNFFSKLNGPQKILLLVAVVFSGLLLAMAIYEAAHDEEAKKPTAAVAIPTANVTINEKGFSPATLTVKAGTQVTWTNSGKKPHQVAADPHPLNNSIEGFDSNTTLLPMDSESFVFEDKGTYTLHDHLNPLNKSYQMKVVVE